MECTRISRVGVLGVGARRWQGGLGGVGVGAAPGARAAWLPVVRCYPWAGFCGRRNHIYDPSQKIFLPYFRAPLQPPIPAPRHPPIPAPRHPGTPAPLQPTNTYKFTKPRHSQYPTKPTSLGKRTRLPSPGQGVFPLSQPDTAALVTPSSLAAADKQRNRRVSPFGMTITNGRA